MGVVAEVAEGEAMVMHPGLELGDCKRSVRRALEAAIMGAERALTDCSALRFWAGKRGKNGERKRRGHFSTIARTHLPRPF